MRPIALASAGAASVLMLALAGCGHTMEERAATGAATGLVVAGPVGAAVGAAAGAAVNEVEENQNDADSSVLE
ncbi:MAG: hypothetical protein R3C52_15475 [Hyphomonadaceae bacterium]